MGWSLRTLILTMVLVGSGGGESEVLPRPQSSSAL